MSEGFSDFFDENTHWVEQGSASVSGSEPPLPPKSRREMRKRRERHQRKRIVVVIAVIVVLVLLAGGGYFGVRKLIAWRDNRAAQSTSAVEDYPGPGSGSVSFTVEEGQDASVIAKNLVKAEVVKSVEAFTSAVSSNNAILYPGTFELKKHMAAVDVVTVLSDSSNASGFLEVRSGERVSDVLSNAAELSGIGDVEFKSITDGGGSDILPSEAGGSFEGWLEPGSYNVKSMTSASDILKAMVDKRIAKLDKLGVPSGDKREEILKIASIAEAEVNSEQYYGKVTRVIDNRLEQGMTLGMDTAIAYGLGIKASELTDAQLEDSSNPYNLRKNAGLPPTPISNPGDKAIKAALNPESGDWLYFVTTNLETGETKFTTGSIDEQNAQFDQYVSEYKNNNANAN